MVTRLLLLAMIGAPSTVIWIVSARYCESVLMGLFFAALTAVTLAGPVSKIFAAVTGDNHKARR